MKQNMRMGQVRRSVLTSGVALAMITLLVSAGGVDKKSTMYHKDWIDFNKNGTKDVYEDPTQPMENRIENLLSQMTTEEKTCQMVTLYGYGRVAKDEIPTPEWKNELWKDGLGNIDEASNGVYKEAQYKFPYKSHVWALNEIQRFFVEDTRLGVPVEFTNEGIRGLNHYKATCFPAQLGMGATWDKDLLYKTGEVIGKEAHALGYNNIYSPVLDVARDQRWGRIVESFGEDPFLVASYGIHISKGIQEQGVVNSLKHYAVYSAPKGGRDGHVRCDPHITPREMQQIYLYPFEQTIKHSNVMGVMSSYNDYDGVPITGSSYFLQTLLRDTYGFKGYVVSDSDAVAWLWSKHKVAQSYKDAVFQSVSAGLNVRTTFNHPSNFVNPLRELIAEGALSEEVIDSRVRDVLRVKFTEGLFDQPFRKENAVDKVVRNKKHLALAKRASRESIVLLKNTGVLPLDLDNLSNILVVGPNAKAESSSHSRYGALGTDIINPLEGIKTAVGTKAKVTYVEGCELHDLNWPFSEAVDHPLTSKESQQIAEAVAKAKESDVIIAVMGEDETMVGENLSRTSLNLPGVQTDLLKALKETGKPVILVLVNGRPLSINYAERNLDGILAAWFPGEFGGEAIADVLFGNYNPGGKLATTWPAGVGQIPLNFPYKPGSQAGQAKEGPNGTGESRLVAPLYPFGYGLSYTGFNYSNLRIQNQLTTTDGSCRIQFDITNTGDRDGEEVSQLYVHDEYGTVIQYDWQLRGYDRIALKAGETKTVEFTLVPDDLSLLNREMKRVVEAGEFKIAVGSSSVDFELKETITLSE